jgi:leader peptidase (prepilin peptidase)/N-methyltransferase
MFLAYILSFAFGASWGSFLNVLIHRTAIKEEIIFKPSHCPHCGRKIARSDLVPIFSFLILRGRCRLCGNKISFQYPLVELAAGILFLFVVRHFFVVNILTTGGLIAATYWIIVGSLLIVIFVYDLKHYLIPDKFNFLLIGVSIVYMLIYGVLNFGNEPFGALALNRLGAALAGAAFFLILFLVTRGRGMGLGDAKLALAMGLILGWPHIVVGVFGAFFAAALVSVYLMIFKGKGLKSKVPFGPFLVAGTFFAILWGSQIINWYLFPLQGGFRFLVQ